MKFKSIINDIKSLKIQGASNVADSGIKAIVLAGQESKAKTPQSFFKELHKKKEILFSARPTEPSMRNLVNYLMRNLESKEIKEIDLLKKTIKVEGKKILKIKNNAEKKMVNIGQKIINKNSIVYTHCHSSSVNEILKAAHKKKKFEVYNTETRPKFQGRITAKNLSKSGIKVTHFIDSNMLFAIRKCDIILLGADSITPTHFYNKIGSSLILEIADKYDTPVYICSTSFKFNYKTIMGTKEEIEFRSPDEVWPKAPRNIKIFNPAFEKLDLNKITGIISELGILPIDYFMNQINKEYPWLMEKNKK